MCVYYLYFRIEICRFAIIEFNVKCQFFLIRGFERKLEKESRKLTCDNYCLKILMWMVIGK